MKKKQADTDGTNHCDLNKDLSSGITNDGDE